ncbi:putative carboxypeptidase U transcription factor interactor and regulator Znf-B family [Dioscorea sansibarensis]
MDVDSSPERSRVPSPRDAILKRLAQRGVPQEHLDQFQPGLVAFVRENNSLLPEIVCCILPSVKDMSVAWRKDKPETAIEQRRAKLKALFGESLLWMQWLMFEGEPHTFLKNLAEKSSGQRAVCGAVWGQDELAYKCRTCEYDPTCAICVPCFQNGDHRGHDYSILYTNGGCCDCGDVTAWKREGFCSMHKGSEQIQPLPNEMVHSIGLVLHELFLLWKDRILSVEYLRLPLSDDNHANVHGAQEFSLAIIEMLLDFCNSSEGLLSFVAKQTLTCVGLLDVLLMGERFLDKLVVKKLLEVLLKFIVEPLFKYEFAKAFMRYYQRSVREIIKENSQLMLEEYPLLFTFSVQIFTVATLIPHLVREINLLDVLLSCLSDIFLSCVGEDGKLQATKWANLYEITIRLIEDICYVLSHEEVLQYVSRERVDVFRSWIRLLSLLQGMDSQKRVRSVHIEEENENLHRPFLLVHYLGKVHDLLVNGFFSVVESKEREDDIFFPCGFHGLDDDHTLCHAKRGRISQESFVGNLSSGNAVDHDKNAEDKSERYNHISVPSSGIWLIVECLEAVESWVSPVTTNRNNLFSMDAMSSGGYKVSNLRKKNFRIKKGSSSSRVYRTCLSREVLDVDQVPVNHATLGSPPVQVMTTESREAVGRCGSLLDISDISKTLYEDGRMSELSDDNSMGTDYIKESETPGVLSFGNWPDIVYDVSSQEISFHIPLHRLLSKLFQKAMTNCYAGTLEMTKGVSLFPSCVYHHEFFGQVLGAFHPHEFSAFLMEHPLRLRVFCAQVRAGMWRKNGDAAILSSECYRSSIWLDQGLELDLFLMQCSAAVAPPELFVQRIQERFGLSDYTSLNLTKHDEFEAVLVQEMLILIIQIVKERRFCGLSTLGYLRRELIHKLAAGDATHSQLLKSIPREFSKSEQLHKALDTLAMYSNPSGMKQGKYSLQELYWKELDLYHPRWNSWELQIVEERYGRFCNVSALNVQLPQWTEIYCPLITVSTIATSRAALQIIRAVLYYALFADVSSANRAPDSVVITALHLLALALDICEKSNQVSAGNSEHMDGQSCTNAPCYSKDLLLVLSFACEEFDVGLTDGSPFWKSQNMLSLLVSLMRKDREGKNKQYTETRQCNISSLIETLLKKFVQLSAACKAEIRKLEPELIYDISQRHSNTAMENSALDSGFEERRAKIRERQAAILEKMRAEQSKFIAGMAGSSKDDPEFLESNQEVSMSDDDYVQEKDKQMCSFCRDPDSQRPLCYLIHLQTSKLASFVNRGPLSWEDDDKFADAHVIGKDVLDVLSGADSASSVHSTHTTDLEFSHDIGPAEINSSLEFFMDKLHDSKGVQPPNDAYGAVTKLSLEMVEFDIYQSVERLTYRTKSNPDYLDGNSLHSTSHSSEVMDKGKSAEFSLVGEYLSSLSRWASKQHQSSVYNLQGRSNTLSNSPIPANVHNGVGSGEFDGIYISSCGHVVHQECHERYLLSLKQRSIRRLGIEGGQIVDPDMRELVCPVCRRFANSILPANPVSANIAQRQIMPSTSNAAPIVTSSTCNDKVLHLQLALTLLQSTAKMVGHHRFLRWYSGNLGGTTELVLEPAVHKLCLLQYPHSFGSLTASGRLRPSLILWNTLTYSLMSLEIAAREKINPHSVDSNSCLKTIYNELHSSSGSILSSLLCISQNSRSMNDLEVLLRFRAIQLFSGSICSDVSDEINLLNEGSHASLLEQTNHGETFPDTQFWKRAVDPILAYDPFSSLMLVLFSLPLPFLSSTEFFMALVHLFYVVSVIQAMITCYNNCYFDVSCFGDWILSDVCEVIGRSKLALKYFFSDCIDSSLYPKDVIRRLTLPYLRRCALLWQLIQSSNLAPSCNGTYTGKGLNSSMDNTSVIENSYVAIELTSLRELEKMFQICSLEVILQDELVHALAKRWCQHFCGKFKVRKYEHFYCCSPAIPFKLMQLPQIYQDLLQRYVKLQCCHCKSIPDEPALCLLCGKLCSPSWKYCCRESRCLEHAMTCGAGIGVFLLVRKTTILLQRSVRLAFWPSPYLDAYGEEDLNMARGEPLYLNEDRYKALACMVASHSFDHTSEVLHQTPIGLFVAD